MLKLYYHIFAFIKIFLYKLIYAKHLKLGKKLTFRKGFSLVIIGNGKIEIGKNVFFNNYCSVASCAKVTIGDGTIFGENVKIYDQNHITKDKNMPIKKQGYTSKEIHIGKHCWIASNVVILKGVSIGDNCTIGAGCIIYKDVPANSIVVNKQSLLLKEL